MLDCLFLMKPHRHFEIFPKRFSKKSFTIDLFFSLRVRLDSGLNQFYCLPQIKCLKRRAMACDKRNPGKLSVRSRRAAGGRFACERKAELINFFESPPMTNRQKRRVAEREPTGRGALIIDPGVCRLPCLQSALTLLTDYSIINFSLFPPSKQIEMSAPVNGNSSRDQHHPPPLSWHIKRNHMIFLERAGVVCPPPYLSLTLCVYLMIHNDTQNC